MSLFRKPGHVTEEKQQHAVGVTPVCCASKGSKRQT